jgi:hypothetical protein
MNKNIKVSSQAAIPFVKNDDRDYDFMSGGNMFSSNYVEVGAEVFESAYEQVITNISRSITSQNEKQIESGFQVDQVTLNLEFGMDEATGRLGITGGIKMNVVLKPAEVDQNKSKEYNVHSIAI